VPRCGTRRRSALNSSNIALASALNEAKLDPAVNDSRGGFT